MSLHDTKIGKRKAGDNQIVESYGRHGNIWVVASELGMCGQSIHERLVRLGVQKKMNHLTDEEKIEIRRTYESGIERGDGKLVALSKIIGRTIPFISRYARASGLTSYTRSASDDLCKAMGLRAKEMIIKNGHPRGMLGKKHSKEAREKMCGKGLWKTYSNEKKSGIILKAIKTKYSNGTLYGERSKVTWKSAWREIGGVRKYYRSRWEANYARYLQFLKEQGKISSWQHEPKTFWFDGIMRGCRSYLPDFLVKEESGVEYFCEVKGWMDSRSITKIKRMAKYHPDVELRVVDKNAYKDLERQFKYVIQGWE